VHSACLWSALDDRGAKQVLERGSPSGKEGKLQRHQRRLKNDKNFVYELNRGKFFSKALSVRLFFAQKQIQSANPCRQLSVCDYSAAGMQKSLGPQIKLPAKRCLELVVVLLIFFMHVERVEVFFLFIGGQERPLERREAIVPASWRAAAASLCTHPHAQSSDSKRKKAQDEELFPKH
jgi:hypothetical protein